MAYLLIKTILDDLLTKVFLNKWLCIFFTQTVNSAQLCAIRQSHGLNGNLGVQPLISKCADFHKRALKAQQHFKSTCPSAKIKCKSLFCEHAKGTSTQF